MKTSYILGIVLVVILVGAVGAYLLLNNNSGQCSGKCLVVGTNVPFPPFEYQLSNGTVTGFDMDVIRALAIQDGYNGITIKNFASFDSLIPALQQGQVDVVAAGMTITPDRQAQVNFTNPYWQADQSILVLNSSNSNPQSITDLAGKTVGVQTGTTGESLAEQYNTTLGPIKHYDTFLLAVLDLVNGKLDAVIVDSPVATAFTGQYSVRVASTVVTGEQWGFAVKIGNTSLLNGLNSALATFKGSTQWNALIKQYFGTQS
ncbi:MAG TPA: basic amino acid ABC transporter substrate-binding protein [Conexivisphaerales archaeon]|nr:basic amino acid ABC transporter substrate-binding protein [Conexivisphaerales archaeon]